METARKRIIDFIENQSIKTKDFLSKTGLKKGFTDRSHQESGITDIYLSKILEAYPELNPTWLLTGKGEMLLKEDSDPKDHLPDVGDMVSLEEYKAQVKAATRLEIQLEQCQERVKALEKTVDQLKSAGSGVGRKELK